MQTRRGGSERLIITLALLSAIGVILGKFLAINIGEFLRFSFENLTIFLASVAFGPIAGMTVGIAEDVIGCMIAGYVWNPIITLGAALNGLVCGVIYKLLHGFSEPKKIALSVLCAHLAGSVLTKTLGLSIFLSLPFALTLGWRTLNYLIVGTAEIILLIYLLKSKVLLSNIQKIKNISKAKEDDEADEL